MAYIQFYCINIALKKYIKGIIMSVQMIEINTMDNYIHFEDFHLNPFIICDKIKIDMSIIGNYL